jgi:hypothetical protein
MKRLVILLAFSQVGATDCGNAVRDPSFDLWCGQNLCAWKLERGDVGKVPTWNAGDPGVELIGDDVAIEQLSPVDFHDGSCLEFDLIADVDTTAQVDLNIDVFGDGSVEHTERVPTSHWKPISFLLPIQGSYGGIRFELAKKGSGHAVLANIGAKIVDSGCEGLDPIIPAPAPNGAVCDSAAGCQSGICGSGTLFAGQCVGCDGSTICGTGMICGIGEPLSPVYSTPMECTSTSKQLGDNCFWNQECASGICTNGACSTCKVDGTGCTAGETCGSDWYAGHTPYLCNPLMHAGAAGAPCASDDDCASALCAGETRMQCSDGRACSTAANCPFGGPGTDNGLQNGPCDTVGVQGGICQ